MKTYVEKMPKTCNGCPKVFASVCKVTRWNREPLCNGCLINSLSTHDREKDAEIAELKKRNAVLERALDIACRYNPVESVISESDYFTLPKEWVEKAEAELKDEETR